MVNEESLNEICRQILEDGQREVDSILDKARRTADSILEKARQNGQKASEEILKEAEAKAQAIKKRTLSTVALEAKRERLRLREELFKEVMSRIKEKLGKLRELEQYPEVLTRLAFEAIDALRKNEITIFADSRDIELVKKEVVPSVVGKAKEKGVEIDSVEVRELDRPVLGGLMVGATGGNVIYDNTFESRIYRMENEIRGIVYREVSPE